MRLVRAVRVKNTRNAVLISLSINLLPYFGYTQFVWYGSSNLVVVIDNGIVLL